MDFNCCLENTWLIFLIFFAFPYTLNCQFHTTGYAYQVIYELEEGDSLSSDRMQVQHNCWNENACRYVAKLKTNGQYVMLKSKEELDNKKYHGIWEKRVEDIDECASNPCPFGRTCVNRIGSFSCICNRDQTGSLCQEHQWEQSCFYRAGGSRLFLSATKEACLSVCIMRKLEGAVAATYITDMKECICSKTNIKVVDSLYLSDCILL